LTYHWQSKGEEIKGRIDQLVSENERPYPENQQLIEANEFLAIDGQNLQAVQGQLNLAVARLNRHADALRRRFKNGAIESLLSTRLWGSSQAPKGLKNNRQHNSA
jgi:hypothetical protein